MQHREDKTRITKPGAQNQEYEARNIKPGIYTRNTKQEYQTRILTAWIENQEHKTRNINPGILQPGMLS